MLALTLLGPLALACGTPGDGRGPTAPAAAAPNATGHPAAAPAPARPSYRATIRWTRHGVPHIEAENLASLGFGQGYAFARGHACVLAEELVGLRGERARYFGAGPDDANVTSDFGYLALGVYDRARRWMERVSDDGRALFTGFAAGYNRYVAEVGVANLPPPCAGAAWVREVQPIDVVAYSVRIANMGSLRYFLAEIGAAQPPGAAAAPAGSSRSSGGAARPQASPLAPASNGWGVGGERTASGRGILVANPHFYWEGPYRFYEAHLTVPGDFDAYGATLLGVPLISMGFNANLAWTHTFSRSSRFVIYRLTLADGDATAYRYGDETRLLQGTEHTIAVLQPDGTTRQLTRTLYRSHHGPVLSGSLFPWTGDSAFAIRSVTDNPGAVDQYLAMIRARNLAEFQAAFERYQATPFVNTVYADRDGNAWYVDGSAVPDLPLGALAAWRVGLSTIPALARAWERGVVVLDGSRPLFELAEDPAAAVPGQVPYARAPRLARRDYVVNANDSYWLTNPEAPLTGFSPLFGETGKPPSARTRMNLLAVASMDKAGKEDAMRLILDDRALTADLLRGPVVARCRGTRDRKLARACDTLAKWDGRYDTGSVGAVLWREFWASLADPWDEPFDPGRPVVTPRGLKKKPKRGPDPVLEALGAAIARLEGAGIDPFGAPLGAVQFTERAGRRISIPGSPALVGIANMVGYHRGTDPTVFPTIDAGEVINQATGLTDRGYPINFGTSFLMVVAFTDDGPDASALMTYSASSDPTSPHHADQTEMFAAKTWRQIPFSRAALEAAEGVEVKVVTGP